MVKMRFLTRRKDTLGNVFKDAERNINKIDRFRGFREGQKVKKISKTAVKPLEKEKRIMYNSAVVCSGMKR